MTSVANLDLTDGYTAYAYSYPHKSSYQRLVPPIHLADAWRNESLSSLFLYIHIPLCEMRCGFCNLFTLSQPQDDLVETYLTALERQSHVIRDLLHSASFARFAMGGGTPTMLSARQLERVVDLVRDRFGVDLKQVPGSIETSPDTADKQRLQILSDRGFERISIGVQSFQDDEAHRMGRPQKAGNVYRALETIRSFDFPILNIDLIYGAETQTVDSWLWSIREALRFRPEEIFLYPLYVRPETGLGRLRRPPAVDRTALYVAGRDLLLSSGYEQLSMRCFRLRSLDTAEGPTYCCQRDGMIGLGCGARSYTRQLHYASRFAVTQAGIQAILTDWMQQSDQDFAYATHGFQLTPDELQRRQIILSLLQSTGLDLDDFASRFACDPLECYPVLGDLIEGGYVTRTKSHLQLTADGMTKSDAIGPLLYSPAVRTALEAFIQR